MSSICFSFVLCCFFFQAEDGIRDLVRSRGLGDVYKRQDFHLKSKQRGDHLEIAHLAIDLPRPRQRPRLLWVCLLYTSDAADERSSVDLGGRRIIKKKNDSNTVDCSTHYMKHE